MIAFKWKRKSNGEPLAKIRVEHLLTRSQLAALLLAAGNLNPDELPELGKAEIEKRIRDQLWFSRDAMDWWYDKYQEDDHEKLEEWAARQVAKL